MEERIVPENHHEPPPSYILRGAVIGAVAAAGAGALCGAVEYLLVERKVYNVWAAALSRGFFSGVIGAYLGTLAGALTQPVLAWRDKRKD
jgi:hypothetical protein